MSKFKNSYFYNWILSQAGSLRALPQSPQELKQAWPVWISCYGSCGCVALRSKRSLLHILKKLLLINQFVYAEKIVVLFNFKRVHITVNCKLLFLSVQKTIILYSFAQLPAAERTVRDNTVGSRGLAASANGYEIFCLTKGQAHVLVKSLLFN